MFKVVSSVTLMTYESGLYGFDDTL
jgi:hypothetical protein